MIEDMYLNLRLYCLYGVQRSFFQRFRSEVLTQLLYPCTTSLLASLLLFLFSSSLFEAC